MQKMLYSAVLLTYCLSSIAQITVTSSTFPGAGDTLRYAVDDRPTVDPQSVYTPPGFNQTWDFSKLQPRILVNQVFLSANTGKNVASFPGADLVTTNGVTETYYNRTSSRLETMGYAGTDPFGFNLKAIYKLSPPFPERRAPLNFFDINQSSTSILQGFSVSELPQVVLSYLPIGTAFDSLRIRMAISRISTVNASGTLKLPFAQYEVLREKSTQYREYRVDAKVRVLGWLDVTDAIIKTTDAWDSILGVDTTVTHLYYNDKSKEVIAQVNWNTAENKILSVRFKAPPRATVPVREVQPPTTQLQVIPNPVDEEIQLNFVPLISGQLRIELHDALGRTLKTSQVEVIQQQKMRWQMPGHDLPNGRYTLVLSTADRLETVPLVVQH
jgi:hypothetical protein